MRKSDETRNERKMIKKNETVLGVPSIENESD